MEISLTKAIDSFWNILNLPSLSETKLQNLNSPEINQAIHSLPNGNSPGPNRYSNTITEHFIPLHHHISALLIFNQAIIDRPVPLEMLQTTIVTMPKPGKTPDCPANFRPISLLNTHIKWYAKLLANRILKVLPTLINPVQVGFIKGRQAPNGTRRLLNILSKLEQTFLHFSYHSMLKKHWIRFTEILF